jgi:hypothetical protein
LLGDKDLGGVIAGIAGVGALTAVNRHLAVQVRTAAAADAVDEVPNAAATAAPARGK